MDHPEPSFMAGTLTRLRPLTSLPPEIVGRVEVRVFVKVRDEAVRLPHFLAHYRRLGIHRFLIIDHESTDGTTALLGEQPDVHLFAAEGSFAAAGGGQAWLDELLDCYGAGHWCLTVDADELLCFPGSETLGLPALCGMLDREGAEALPCLMLDMYGAAPLGALEYMAGESFLAACPWFDPGPYWRTNPNAECPPQEIYGGVRQRVFYPQWQAPSRRLRLSERCYDFANRLASIRGNRTIQSWRTKRPPNLAKVPLVRWRRGLRYLAVTHRITPVRLSAGSGCLLHFKFLDNFGAKAAREAKRGEYFDGAREYKRYAAVMADAPTLTLWHEGSVRFEGSEQLCRLGLMTPLPKLRAPAAREAASA